VWVLAGALLVNRAGSMILPFLVLYATRERGFSAEQAGLVITFFGLGTMLASPLALGVFVLERFGPGALWGGCLAVALCSGALLARVQARPEPAREPT
jgi:hypothetical protein